MKITISPSEDQSSQAHSYYSVTVEFPNDESFTADQAVEMFVFAMTAFGFDQGVTTKAMSEYKY